MATQPDAAGGRLPVSRQAVEEGALASAVRADQADDRAALDRKGNPVESGDAAEADGDRVDVEQGLLGRERVDGGLRFGSPTIRDELANGTGVALLDG